MNNKKIFEKIITEKRAKSSNERPKYGLRKLTVGVVSCLLGYMMFMTPNVALAEKVEKVEATTATIEQPAEEVSAKPEEKPVEEKQEEAIELSDETAAKDEQLKAPVEEKEAANETDKSTEFKLTDEQKKKLEDAGFDEEQIQVIVNEIKAELAKNKDFDIQAFIDKKIEDIDNSQLTKAPENKNIALRAAAGEGSNVDTTNSDTEEAGEDALLKKLEAEAIDATGQEGDKRSYSGTAYVYRSGNINAQTKETLAGVPIYLQWIDKDGYISPVFKTTSKADGSYTFTFDKPIVDELGNSHKWQLAGNADFAIRTWAGNPDSEKWNVIKPGDQKAGFHKRLSRINESWDFTAGINRIVGGQVVLQEKPLANDWLVGPKENWRESPDPSGEWKNAGAYGKIDGKVWFDGGDPSGSDARMYKKDSWDLPAAKTKVVASYVNDEVARMFDQWKKDNNYKGSDGQDNPRLLEFREAQKKIIEEYEAKNGKGSHIAETVVGTVDSDGNYYLPFRGLYGISRDKKGSATDENYGKLVDVKDESHKNLMAWNGTAGQKHRHINKEYMYASTLIENYSIWSNTAQNNMFALLDGAAKPVGPSNLASANIQDVNFVAVVAKPAHAVNEYNTVSKFAPAGADVNNASEGLLPSSNYQQRWFKDGKPYGEATNFVTTPDGKAPNSIPLHVDDNLGAPAKFTSAIFLNGQNTDDLGEALAADGFIAVPKVKYEPIEKKAGEEAKTEAPKYIHEDGSKYTPNENDGKPTFSIEKKKETVDKNGETQTSYEPLKTVKVGDKDVPVTVDPQTGEVTIKAEDTKDLKGQTVTVPVTLTYPNGMKVISNAVIKIAEKLQII